MKQTKILLIPCDTEIAYEIIDSLKYHKYFKLECGCHERKKKYLYKDISFLPYEYDLGFYESLNKLIIEKEIDLILPANDNLAFELSKNSKKIRAKLVTQPWKVHEIVRFKDRTYSYFNDLIPCPDTYTISDINEKIFPIFVKPKKGQGSLNAFKISSDKELRLFLLNYDPEDFVIMEYLPNNEFTIDCFAHNGKLLYYLARKREKTFRGISIQTSAVTDKKLNSMFEQYAKIIAENLGMHGIFFFQMKLDKEENPKLLEVGARVPGSLSLNRAFGVNLIELSIYQALGLINERSVIYSALSPNEIDFTLFRPLGRVIKGYLNVENIYVDFDDTLLTPEGKLNLDVVRFIFHCKNQNKRIFLITKNKNNSLYKKLDEYGIKNVFDNIFHMSEEEKKTNYMIRTKSLLIDDSFVERKEAMEKGILAYSPGNVKLIEGCVQ